ncbi:MAG: hypothetical protein ACHQDC_10775 [Acidimicrobiales bacterium]
MTWAAVKTVASVFSAPITIPAALVSARRNIREATARIDAFPEHLHAMAEGRPSPLPAPRTLRLPADRRYLITSDLHRCIPGRLDWPERQGTKTLYPEVLRRYADDGWHLIENGDVEDYWMVGGSTWGAVYDLARMANGLAGPTGSGRRRLIAEHLDRIVENNADTYRLIADRFLASGRYHRTMGNHDELYANPQHLDALADHLPGVDVVDTILLDSPDATTADGLAGVEAVITHGHMTDAWNGPGISFLGAAVTWFANTIDDLPRIGRTAGLPDEEALGRLLAGRGFNRLVTLDPRFGGNRRFDSLDEERLFARLQHHAPSEEWPWMLFGHTHFPMKYPVDSSGVPARYANSGCGVLDRSFSALEWDPSAGSRSTEVGPTVVLWTDSGHGPVRRELLPDGPVLAVRD